MDALAEGMFKAASKAVLVGTLRQVARLPMTRRTFHKVSESARGASVAFLRCRRVLPNSAQGNLHPDRLQKSALTAAELHRALSKAKKTLEFVHPGEALTSLSKGTRLAHGVAVLTFDESFAATAELALPVLRDLKVPALFFVSTGHFDGRETLWDQAIHTLVDEVSPAPLSVPWVDRVLQTDSPTSRARAVRRLLMLLIKLDEHRLVDRLMELNERAGSPKRFFPLDRMLTDVEVERLSQDPMVSIGAHGHLHLPFGSISDEALERELVLPREMLQKLCGSAFADVVSYPFGRLPHVGKRAITRAREVGYRAGLTALPGVSRPGDHLFTLPRLPMAPDQDSLEAYELQGISDAVDEFLLVATGTFQSRFPDVEG
ncbi:MAG: polysaccharide deacetylase family protein [Deltaproteobacteria bacterium]|nr:polysaccharide deacetylase family protein [Deltaproteobacteria bacterium]